MVCPKCSHEQDDTVKCSACGVYFAKFHPPQAVTEARPRRSRVEPAQPGLGAGALVVTAILTAAVVFNFTRKFAAPTSSPPIQSGSDVTQPAAGAPNLAQSTGGAIPAQSAGALSTRNPIEAARNATVFIRTGWGLGSGFIIDQDCHVI